ncbi:hypothetical protein DM01DRAFT_1409129 [Hesseltinella vesiculosa]|uniref:Yeast cell wall synthesis Kre9/Knh1-like N-terminal domain-containing protein n=1 Tax=Hesseltinella vesiculosa TaxID=101127 RepID=A0A1X2GBQ7_9FUNG|nr:hypothetical protein DM01DRAFT_1409129 [Hesseltinella vesiculosa]
MIKSIVAIAALAASAVVNADGILSVTAPLTGASYQAGSTAIVSWVNPSVTTITQIVLAQGQSTALQPVKAIATNVTASSGSYTWNIPSDTPPGTNYALEFGTSPNMSFSGQFSITAGSGGSSNSSSNSSSSASGAGSTSTAAGAKSSSSTSSAGKLAPVAVAVAAVGAAAWALC